MNRQNSSSALQGPAPAADREFLWKVHGYTNDYIRFADTKAAFCVGIASALMGVLFASKSQQPFMNAATGACHWTMLAGISLTAFALLGASIVLGAIVVRPRLWTRSERGFIFWQGIAAFGSSNKFVSEYTRLTEKDLTECLSEHLYSLAVICERKYFWVNVAIIAALGGGSLAAITLLLQT